MAFEIEVIVEVGMDAGELLQRLHTPEPEHRSLSSSERQMAVFDPVVGPASDLLLLHVTKLFHCCTIRPQTVSCDRLRAAVTLQRLLHEAQRGLRPGRSARRRLAAERSRCHRFQLGQHILLASRSETPEPDHNPIHEAQTAAPPFPPLRQR
jgi:hypothetical protein